MKKIYFSLLSATLTLCLNAQTLTQANHAPVSGDTYSMTVCNGTITGPGASGAGSTWNFSNVTLSSTITAYTGTTSSNTTYTPANIVVNGSNGEASYLLASSNDLKYYGGNIVIGGFPATITYTSPAFYAKYPMSLNTLTTATTGGTLSALSNNGTFTGNNLVVADGTGTLMLPGKTYTNVLRVATSQTITFNVPSLGISNGSLIQNNYDFYVSGKKAPVFSISTSTVSAPPIISTSSQTVISIASDYITGLKKETSEYENILVYPNPSSSTINFVTGNVHPANVSVYDISGRSVSTSALVNGSLTLDVTNYAAGTYFYKITGSDKQVLKTGKIAVTH